MSFILYWKCLDITHLSSLQISKELLAFSLVLDEDLMKFKDKRIFNPTDEPQLMSISKSSTNGVDKRIFEPCDKQFFHKGKKTRSNN